MPITISDLMLIKYPLAWSIDVDVCHEHYITLHKAGSGSAGTNIGGELSSADDALFPSFCAASI